MTEFDALAETIAAARLGGRRLNLLPGESTPGDLDAAYAVQDAVHQRLEAAGGGETVGWKIGCTTPVMQAYLGIPHPCAGRLCARGVLHSPAEIPASRFVRPGAECEIAVRLAADLTGPGPFDRARVAGAVGACMAAIELVDDRYADWRSSGAPILVADDFFGAGCVLGPEQPDWRSLDLAAVTGRLSVDGTVIGNGRGDAVLGHPLDALAWLANDLARRGQSLTAGQIVLLGSVVQVHWARAGEKVSVAFEGLGEAHLSFV